MRIVMSNFDLPPAPTGGVPRQVARLAAVLQRRGHEVTVLTANSPTPQPFKVRHLKVPNAALHRRSIRLATTPFALAFSSFRGADVVHCHGDSQFLWRPHLPIVRTFHGSARDEARYAETLQRRWSQRGLYAMESIARRAATVTVGNSSATAKAVGHLDFIIPCGVDLTMYHAGAKSVAPSILFVGTLRGRKRGWLILQQFHEIIRDRVPGAELWMVCPEKVAMEGVKWLPGISDEQLAELYRQAWVFCMPSTYEGFGVPYIEALASGTAVVATKNAGASEILDFNAGSTIVNEAQLGLTISDLLRDDSKRTLMQSWARSSSERFDWRKVAENYELAYSTAIERIRAGRFKSF